MGYSAFLQKTGPDKAFSSGAFGCVRNNGYKFHEGLDLYPVKRDGRGRAEDNVFSAMSGIVRHLNATSGYSAYGKYLVLEHTTLTPPLYSLYAHLASIQPGLKVGSNVQVAQVLGKMGNTASYGIPLDRSHLHFEIGLRLTDNFQSWYDVFERGILKSRRIFVIPKSVKSAFYSKWSIWSNISFENLTIIPNLLDDLVSPVI
jgi:murein DD-endopeptidase MepM/ murein hydrolase activator NlpD